MEGLKDKPKDGRHPKISIQTGRIQNKGYSKGKQLSGLDHKAG